MQITRDIHIALHTERPIDARGVRALYDTANWWPKRNPNTIAQMIDADLAIGVWDQDRLIAFARAITDGRFRAYIEDVVVHPAYRRQGIAAQMLARLVESLDHIETISLFCTSELVEFYAQFGFKTHENQLVMHRVRRA